LVDLHFADAKEKKIHDCNQCPAQQKAQRKCAEKGFRNAKTARFRVDERGQKYTFCPGKATWFERTARVYQECYFAFHTGILPKEGHFQDQDELFVEAYPAFVHHYTQRKYGRVWQDVNEFASEVFKAIGKMFGKGK
jgi:hypothetical protein